MRKTVLIAILPLLFFGGPDRCCGGTPEEARADYEKLTERYLDAYRTYLRARLSGSTDVESFRRVYEVAFTDYLNSLRAQGQKADIAPEAATAAISLPAVALIATPSATPIQDPASVTNIVVPIGSTAETPLPLSASPTTTSASMTTPMPASASKTPELPSR